MFDIHHQSRATFRNCLLWTQPPVSHYEIWDQLPDSTSALVCSDRNKVTSDYDIKPALSTPWSQVVITWTYSRLLSLPGLATRETENVRPSTQTDRSLGNRNNLDKVGGFRECDLNHETWPNEGSYGDTSGPNARQEYRISLRKKKTGQARYVR